MIIDINEYRYICPQLNNQLVNKPNIDIEEYATDISTGTFIPIIVIYYFIMEIVGENKMLLAKTNRLKKFYSYTRIDGYNSLE